MKQLPLDATRDARALHEATKRSRMSISLALAIALTSGLAFPAAAQTSTGQQVLTVDFDIPAGSLSSTLLRFGQQSRLQFNVGSDLTDGKRSAGVKGRLSAEAALRALLAGSGLTFRFSGPRTVVIEAAPEVGDARVLGPLRIEGATSGTAVNGINGSSDVTATEGTNSYTTGAMSIAGKTPQSIKDTPQSVSVVTQQRMQDQNITGYSEALKQATGVTLAQGPTSLESVFYSRGFAIKSIQVDGGAPLSTDYGYVPLIDMAMYDHVEVLRGAAGLFNGYGDPSGTVNLVRKRPLDHAQLTFEAQAGSWDNFRTAFDLTGPLGLDGKLRGRLVATAQNNEHFYDTAEDRKNLFYGILEYQLTPSTLIAGGISYTRQDSVPWHSGLPRYQNGDDLEVSRSTCLCFPWNRWDFDTTELFASVEQTFGEEWTGKLNLTHVSQESSRKLGYSSGAVNPTTGAGPLFNGFMTELASEQLAAEMTVSGAFEFLGQRQEVVMGINHSDTDGGGYTSYSPLVSGTAAAPYQPYPGGPTYYFGSPFGSAPPIDLFGFNPNDALYTAPRDALPNTRYPENGQVQSGAYLNLNLTAFDRWHLALGFRYSRFEYEAVRESLCTSIPTSGAPSPNNCVGRQVGDVYQSYMSSVTNYADEDFTWPPSLSLSFDVTSNLRAYVGYTDIYESQARYLNGDLSAVDPITGSNIEAGLKWASSEGKLNASITAYRIEKEGFAVFDKSSIERDDDGNIFVDPDNGYAVYVLDNNRNRITNGIVDSQHYCCYLTNLDIVHFSRGVDAELTGELLPGWQVAAGYTWNRNEYKGADLSRLTSQASGTPLITLQPEHLLKVWTSYTFSGDPWWDGLRVAAGVNAQSKSFQSGTACVNPNPANYLGVSSCAPGGTIKYSYTQPSYSIWSTRVDYTVTDHWSVALNINNITDARYYKTMGTSALGNWYGEPRSFTLTLRGTF